MPNLIPRISKVGHLKETIFIYFFSFFGNKENWRSIQCFPRILSINSDLGSPSTDTLLLFSFFCRLILIGYLNLFLEINDEVGISLTILNNLSTGTTSIIEFIVTHNSSIHGIGVGCAQVVISGMPEHTSCQGMILSVLNPKE